MEGVGRVGAIAAVQVPFVRDSAEILAAQLLNGLLSEDYEAEIVAVPFKWYPAD
jgi:hypothetical protein